MNADERDVALNLSLKPGACVVLYSDDLPPYENPHLEQHRLTNESLPSQNAIVIENHGDGLLTLQVGVTPDPHSQAFRAARGEVLYQRVPMGKRLARPMISPSWRPIQ